MVNYSILIIGVCFAGIIVHLFQHKSILSPLVILNTIWLIVGAIAPLGLWGLWKPTDQALQIVLVGVMGFNAAGLVNWFAVSRVSGKIESCVSNSHRFMVTKDATGIVYVFLTVAIVLSAVFSYTQVRAILAGQPLYLIRTMHYSHLKGLTAFDKVISYGRMFFLDPIVGVTSVVVMVDWLFGKRRKVLCVVYVGLLIFNATVSAGRGELVSFVLVAVIVLVLASKTRKLSLNVVIPYLSVLLLFGVIVLAITQYRPTVSQENLNSNSNFGVSDVGESHTEIEVANGGDTIKSTDEGTTEKADSTLDVSDASESRTEIEVANGGNIINSTDEGTSEKLSEQVGTNNKMRAMLNNVLSTITIYYTGSVTYMSELLKNDIDIAYKAKGLNFFHSLVFPPVALLTFLDIIDYPPILSTLDTYTVDMIKIGENVSYNALATIFFPFYMDFGLYGVFFGSMVFAWICIYAYNKMIKNNSNLFKVIYAMLLVQILQTSTSMIFYSTNYTLQFFYVWLLFICRVDRIEINIPEGKAKSATA